MSSEQNRRIFSWLTGDTPRKAAVWALLFAALLAFNFKWLDNPPYWDEILGLHNQALWLAKNHFNFAGLYDPLEMDYPGSSVYRPGVWAALYGALYYTLPPLAVHVCGHVLNLLLISGAATLLFDLLRRNGVPFTGAALWTAAALAEPALSGRATAQDQEGVLIFLFVWSIWLFDRGRVKSAVAAAWAGTLVKLTGIIMLAAHAAYWFAALAAELLKERRCQRRTAVNLAVAAGLCLAAAATHLVLNRNTPHNQTTHGLFALFRPGVFIFQFKWVLWWSYVMIGGVLALGAVNLRNLAPRARRTVWLCLILGGGFFLSYHISPFIPIPRYLVVITMPTAAALLWNQGNRGWRQAGNLVAALLLALCLCNQYGALFGAIRGSRERDPSLLERSREFLDTVAADRQLCAQLEANASGRPVVCKWPYVQMLTIPEFRYVRRPLDDVRAVGVLPRYTPEASLQNGRWIEAGALVLYAANGLDNWEPFAPMLNLPEDGYYYYTEQFNSRLPRLALFSYPVAVFCPETKSNRK